MTLLNHNFLIIAQAELCLNGKFAKASFMLQFFLDMKILVEKLY